MKTAIGVRFGGIKTCWACKANALEDEGVLQTTLAATVTIAGLFQRFHIVCSGLGIICRETTHGFLMRGLLGIVTLR